LACLPKNKQKPYRLLEIFALQATKELANTPSSTTTTTASRPTPASVAIEKAIFTKLIIDHQYHYHSYQRRLTCQANRIGRVPLVGLLYFGLDNDDLYSFVFGEGVSDVALKTALFLLY